MVSPLRWKELTKKRIPILYPVSVDEFLMELKPMVKYLGSMLDLKMGFLVQIKATADKAVTAVSA